MTDKYTYRADGDYLIRVICEHCEEPYDAHALSQSQPLNLCGACSQVFKWEKEMAK